MDETRAIRLKRLIYKASYTGMKETDLLLGHFAAAHLGTLDDQGLNDFEALLDAAHGVSAPAASAEDDFEALLDAAHGMPETSDGSGAIGVSRAVTAPDPAVAKATSPEAAADVPSACGSTAQNPAAAGGAPAAPASIPLARACVCSR